MVIRMIKKILLILLFPTLCLAGGITYSGISHPPYTAFSPSSTKFRFIVASDIHCTTSCATLSEAIPYMIALQPELAIFCGDEIEGLTSAETIQDQLEVFVSVTDALRSEGIDVYAIRGNHDPFESSSYTTSCCWDEWNAAFTGDAAMPTNGPSGEEGVTWSVTHKNATFIGLDGMTYNTSGINWLINQSWLDTQLEAATTTHIFTFMHSPSFRVMSNPYNLYQNASARNAYWSSLLSHGVDASFGGHQHFLSTSYVGGTYDVIVGTLGGTDVTSWTYGYSGTVNDPYSVIDVNHYYRDGTFRGIGFLLVEIDDEMVTIMWYHRNADGSYTKTGYDTVFTNNAQE